MASSWLINYATDKANATQPVASTPVAKSTTQGQRSQPVAQPTPMQQAVNTAGNVLKGVGDVYNKVVPEQAKAGLGWAGEQLSKSSKWAEEKLTGGKGWQDFYTNNPVGKTLIAGGQMKTGIGIGPGVGNISPFKDPKRAAAITPFVVDPLNLLGGAGAVTKIPKVAGVVEKLNQGVKVVKTAVKEAPVVTSAINKAKTTEAIYKPIEKFTNQYFRNPEAGKMIEATKQETLQRTNQLFRRVDEEAQGLSPAKRVRVGQIIEGGVSTSPQEEGLRKIAQAFQLEAEKVGKELVDIGYLDKAAFESKKGTYMYHMWDNAVNGKDIESAFAKVPNAPKIDFGQKKFRTNAPGYIRDFTAPTFKGLGTEMKTIEATKLYKGLADKFAYKGTVDSSSMADAVDKGFVFVKDLPAEKGGNILNGQLMPSEIVDYIKRANNIKGQSGIDRLLRLWKASVTVYNPAYHVRNQISNQALGATQTGQNIVEHTTKFVGAVKDYLSKNSQAYKEAVDSGLIKNQNFSEHIDEFLNQGFQQSGKLDKVKSVIKAPQRFQQFSEDTAKLNVFTELRNRGKSIEKAKNLAEEAIFSPYRLNPEERNIMAKILPFYSFYRQSFPFIGKNLIKHPERFTKYPKAEQAFQDLSQPEDTTNMPDYMKDYTRTPFKDKKGNRQYVNLQYFYPWGNFYNTENLPTIANISENPTKALSLGIGLNPVLSYFGGIIGNRDWLKQEIFRPGMTDEDKRNAFIKYTVNSLGPAYPKNIYNNLSTVIKDMKKGSATAGDVLNKLIQVSIGLKLTSFDQTKSARSAAYNRKDVQTNFSTEIKILRSQLRNGDIGQEDFDRKYQELLKNRSEQLLK